MKLTKNDYINILEFYNVKDISNLSYKEIKNKAEEIIALKLCSCIKKVDPKLQNESRAIAICTNNIVNRKGLKINRFTCKKIARNDRCQRSRDLAPSIDPPPKPAN